MENTQQIGQGKVYTFTLWTGISYLNQINLKRPKAAANISTKLALSRLFVEEWLQQYFQKTLRLVATLIFAAQPFLPIQIEVVL